MDRLKEIFAYFLAAMAMFALLCAVYEAMNQRLASSGVLAGIFVAAALLMYLPQMGTFKAFGVEATLIQQKLDRAEEILEKMKQLSIASAKSAYLGLAWSSRIGGIEPRKKQEVLDLISDQLRTIGISDDDRRDIARPHVELIGYDLYFVFLNVARAAVSQYVQMLSANGGTIDTPKTQLIREWQNKMVWTGFEPIEPSLKDGKSFAAYLKTQIVPSIVKSAANDKLMQFADIIGGIYSVCRDRGGYTVDAIAFLDKFQKVPNGDSAKLYDMLMKTP